MTREGGRPLLYALGLLGLLAFLWAPEAALGEAAFWAHDLRHHHLPWRGWAAARWAAGELPLWSPEVGGGFPLMADGQTGVFYPPTQLLFVLLPDPLALNLSLLGHIVLAGLGARALARACGRGEAAALLAGVAYAFSGFMATHALYLGFQNAAAWLPWLCWGVLRRRWGFTGLSAAMMLVAGHPQAAAFGLLLAGALALAERRALPFAGAVALAGIAASPQLIATLELARASLREGGLSDALAGVGSLPPAELLNGLLPRFFGYERPADIAETYVHRGAGYWGQGENHWEMAFYLGVPVVALAVAGLRRDPRWGLVAGISAILMLGEHTPLWPVLRHLPGLSGFRFPVRFSMLLTLAVALLAAGGLDRLLGARPEGLRRGGLGLILGAGLLWAGLALAHLGVGLATPALEARLLARASAPPPPLPELSPLERAALPPLEARTPEQAAARVEAVLQGLARSTDPLGSWTLWPVGLLALAGGGLLLGARGRLGARGLAGGALALAAVDLFAFGRGYQASFPLEQVEREPAALAAIRAAGGEGRTTVLDRRQDPALDTELISASLGLVWGTRDVILPSPLRVVRQEALLAKVGLDVGDRGAVKAERLLANLPLVDLLGVRWLLTVHELDHPRLRLAAAGAVRLYENTGALPRAFLVGCARQLGELAPEAAFAALDGLDPRARAVLEGAPVPALADCAEGGDVGEAEILLDEPERLRIRIRATRPALLVQTDTWYPGWRASVDGRAEEIRRANFVFRGVPVPAGEHEVELLYRPPWLRPALVLAPLAALALLALAALEHRRLHRL